LKAEGLLGSRYRGPYTIYSQDKIGNYQIQNALGSLLKTVYPRHKNKNWKRYLIIAASHLQIT
jgi:hypothetical protein